MSQINRIEGGQIDRSQTFAFEWNGRMLEGHPGDTLASALLANGVRLVGRSFKYHRPRGIFSAGSEEPNALVQLRKGAFQEPNTRATTVELFDGLEATSQNHRGSLEWDLMAANDLLSPFLSAGQLRPWVFALRPAGHWRGASGACDGTCSCAGRSSSDFG